MRGLTFFLGGGLLLAAAAAPGATLQDVRVWSEDGRTRVVLDLSGPAQYNIFTLRGPDRLVVDLEDSTASDSLDELPESSGTLSGVRTGRRADGALRVVLDLNEPVRSRSFAAGPNATHGDRLVIDLLRQGKLTTVRRASERYDEGRDVVIAIDPGHGGRDPGAIGHARTFEKDVALAIGQHLAARIDEEPGMRAVLVRDGDYYVDHRDRMDVARRNNADLFVSIHADAVNDRRANGASVYVLSLDGASDEAARLLAKRENASGLIGGVSLADKDDLLASVLLDLSQNAALSASLMIGERVLDELDKIGDMHRRNVQQAGFLVLKSPDVPSILVEAAFISNPAEEKKLRSSAHRGQVASAILAGIRTYFYLHPPPDTQIAINLRNSPPGQLSYVVASGDTLSEIAERYDVSLAELKAVNQLSNDTLYVGEKLNIPLSLFAGS
jgi:N-acetylmuramoyl-L-alanine amidase